MEYHREHCITGLCRRCRCAWNNARARQCARHAWCRTRSAAVLTKIRSAPVKRSRCCPCRVRRFTDACHRSESCPKVCLWPRVCRPAVGRGPRCTFAGGHLTHPATRQVQSECVVPVHETGSPCQWHTNRGDTRFGTPAEALIAVMRFLPSDKLEASAAVSRVWIISQSSRPSCTQLHDIIAVAWTRAAAAVDDGGRCWIDHLHVTRVTR